jgi:Ca-activated chloride channel family protein
MLWGLPAALLLLAGAIPLILFLHSLKPRGLKIATTTMFVWQRVLRERPLGTQLGWLLRKNILLILQLLAATALIVALADPSLLHIASRSGDMIVVLDLSASMKAKGKGANRFDGLRREFNSLIDGLSAGQKMLVIGAGAEPRLLSPFSADKRRLRELARNLSATDGPGKMKEAILFAHSFLKRGSVDQVTVISDGAFAGAEEFAVSAPHRRFVKVDGGSDNVGIVGFSVRRRPDRPGAAEILVHVRNFTVKAVRLPLVLSLDDKQILREEIDIGANDRRVLIYPFDGALAGRLVAQLDFADDFSTDNRAYLALADTPPVRVLYIGPGNPYLNNLLRSFANLELTSLTGWDERVAAQQSKFDVVICDRVAPPAALQGNLIMIDALPPGTVLARQAKVDNPRLLLPLAKHPLTEGLNLAELQVHAAVPLRDSGAGVALARIAQGPLIYALEQAKLRLVYFGFDLLHSDLPLRVAFPVLFHNIFEWFQPQRLEFPGQSGRAGAPFKIAAAQFSSEALITMPSGKTETLSGTGGSLIFAGTFEAGFYRYKNGPGEGEFAVNLLDEDESQIAPRLTANSLTPKNDATVRGESGLSLWPILLGAVVILLGSELLLAYRQRLSTLPILTRAGALAALAVALLNPRWFQPSAALDVIFAVDLSRSVGQEGREKAREVMEVAAGLKKVATRTGLMSFGSAPEWELPPREEIAAAEFSALLDREETDIQAALQGAAAQIGDGRQGRILLFSDGNENRGETARVTPLLRSQGVQVWTLPVGLSRGRNEIYLTDLTLPRQVDSAESFEIRGAVESLREAPARLRLLRDGVLTAERELRLNAGSNNVSFRDTLSERGNHRYELLVDSAEDTLAENNLLQGVVEVKGPPRVLLISAQKDSQRVLASVLQVQGYAVVQAAPEGDSLSLAELAAFDLLVLDNVPAFQLTHAKMESIEKYVRDFGGGLLVVGGSQSYGAGGYYRTPLERVLPVDMRPPAKLEMPHVALLFVIDKSGSMGSGAEGSTKLDLAKAAAIAAADIMNPTDQVGVLAFDANWDWALPFRQVGKGEWINEKLANLQSDGGTDLYKAMVEAYRGIAGKTASIKHVIALSDGLTDKADFQSLVAKMARDGITVSTVSIGNDADVKLMAEIAKEGKGRGYVALDPQTIPQIFTTETLLISRDLLIEKPVAPSIVTGTGALKGIPQNNLPALRGYVLTYPKPRAELLMRVDKDPLLVSWRYGLGRVMAFTSDLSGRWGKEWVGWNAFPQWASQISRDTMRKVLDGKIHVDFQTDGGAVKVVSDLVAQDGKYLNHLKLKATVATPNQTSLEQPLQQSAPGRYEGKFMPAQRGIHFVTLYAEGNAGAAPLPVATVPYIAPYPKEYRELKANLTLLSRLAEDTGGEMVDPEKFHDALKRLYTPTPGKSSTGQETWWPLAGAGLVLFLADLALRSWPWRRAAVNAA